MQQLLFIHGATTFRSHEAYLKNLQTKSINLDRFAKKITWSARLQQDLGEKYQVLSPSMPNSSNAQYDEWALWFSRIAELLDDDVILVGHSLGAIFLAKYLSEHDFPKRIRATLLVAAPHSDETGEDLGGFKITGNLTKFSKQGGEIIFFHGSDDVVVPLAELEQYKRALPEAETHVLPAPDHFVREEFGEILARIRQL